MTRARLLLAAMAAMLVPLAQAADRQLELHLGKSRAYVHEAVPLTLTLLVADTDALSNIRYPRLANAAFADLELSPPRRTRLSRDGRGLTAYVFEATLRAERSGAFELGPAELEFNLEAPATGSSAYFGATQVRTLRLESPRVHLDILPLPAHGRPADFNGAVGRFQLERRVSPDRATLGTPIAVETTITHTSNVSIFYIFQCDRIAVTGARGYTPSARREANRQVCEQILWPTATGRLEIPGARISYFDPELGRYETLQTQPARIEVAAPGADPADLAPPPVATRSGMNTGIYAGLGLIGGGFGLALLVGRRRRRSVPPPPSMDWLGAAHAAVEASDSETFYLSVYRALQVHFGSRLGLHSAGITGAVVDQVLRPAGMQEDRLQAYTRLFRACDQARFGLVKPRDEMSELLDQLQEIIC